jgi:DNA-binding Lrp family transcriptional regulator
MSTTSPLVPGPDPRPRPLIDAIDTALVTALAEDGRQSNAALARRVGIAESTCADRVRGLRDRGVVRGIHADIDPAAVGLGVEAMVALRFGGHRREQVEVFRDDVVEVPGVLAVYNTSGANDYLVHVAAAGADALRNLVLDHLANRAGVVHVETSLIFEATRGRAPLVPSPA